MQTTESSLQEIERKKAIEILSSKLRLVKDIPSEVLAACPFLDQDIVFEMNGKKVALIVEKEIRTPRWASFLEKNADVLEKFNFEVGILKIENDPAALVFPKHKEIHHALSVKNFGLYLFRNNEISCICHRGIAEKLTRLRVDDVKPVTDRLEQNKHIPEALTKTVSGLQNTFLSSTLKDIAAEYDAEKFSDPEKEYDFIQQAMKEILELSELKDMDQTLNFLRFTDNELRTRGKRDHFLHSFQVFLLGESIIDANSEILCEKLSICKSGPLIFERSWLLASLLHDTGLPYQNTQWSYGIPEFRFDLLGDRRNKHSIDELARCFSSAKGGESELNIQSILYRAAAHERINHGLISAIRLVRKSMEVKKEIYEEEVLPAALSIALHDRDMWYSLMSEKLAPIDLKALPVACMLILADNLETWGRPGSESDPQGHNITLPHFAAHAGSVQATLCFRDSSDAILSRWETNEIFSQIVDACGFFKISINQILLPQ